MTLATAKDAIFDWLEDVTGLSAGKIMWADQDSPKPAKPFLRVKLTSFKQKGMTTVHEPSSGGSSVVTSHNDFTLSLAYFGSDGLSKMLDIKNSLSNVLNLVTLGGGGVVYVDELMGPTDTSMVVDANFEARANMDLWMRMLWQTADADQGVINEVNAEGAYIGVDGLTITVQGVSIPASTVVVDIE